MIGSVGLLALIFGGPLLGAASMGFVGAGTVLAPSLLGLLMTAVIARAS